jgi:hypothetical protein
MFWGGGRFVVLFLILFRFAVLQLSFFFHFCVVVSLSKLLEGFVFDIIMMMFCRCWCPLAEFNMREGISEEFQEMSLVCMDGWIMYRRNLSFIIGRLVIFRFCVVQVCR